MIAPHREKYVEHVTLQTGHRRRSPRSEASDAAVEACAALIADATRDGGAAIPGADGFLLRIEHPGRCLVATVHRVFDRILMQLSAPLVTIGIATHSRCAASLWRRLHEVGIRAATSAVSPPSVPWCAARLEPGLAAESDTGWMGDFERCLAWALIEGRP